MNFMMQARSHSFSNQRHYCHHPLDDVPSDGLAAVYYAVRTRLRPYM
jgi:hypothetical protein